MKYDLISNSGYPMIRLTAETTKEYRELERLWLEIEKNDAIRSKILGCVHLDETARHIQFAIDQNPYRGGR